MALKLIPKEEMSSEQIKEEPLKIGEDGGKSGGIKKGTDTKTEAEIIKKYQFVIDFFQKQNPNPTTELKYSNAYELLVAVILSAQCPDSRVNMVTPKLFREFPTIEDLAKSTPDEIMQYIGSVTFPGNKSGYLVKAAKIIVENFKGIVPEDPNDLQTLPGVGRKTANVLTATLFNKPVIAVDTHVFRVSNRIGLTDAKNPLESEEQLLKHTPPEVASKLSHWLILHGRYICTARNPQCPKCGVRSVCNYYERLISN